MPKILIVDDETSTVNVLSLMLEHEEYQVVTAGDGRQALTVASEERPDLIITDVLMPVMDGYAFYKNLKEGPVTKHIPVIVLTARGAMESAFEAIGADRFMEKPVEKDDLMRAIKALIDHPANLSGRKKHQRVLLAGTYPEILDEMGEYVESLGHEMIKANTTPEVLKKSIDFKEDVLILEVQMESGNSAADVIKAVRLLPEFQHIPIVVYSYYRVSDLGSNDFRNRILQIERAKDECVAAGATEYLERYSAELFKEQIVKYL